VYGEGELENATGTRESIGVTRNVEKAFSHGRVEIFTKVITRPTCAMATVRCIGKMVVTTKDNGPMASNMVKVHYPLTIG